MPKRGDAWNIQNRDAAGAETEPGGPPPPRPNSIGSIPRRLKANEAGTFAGLWIQHQPIYGVVVAFTHDAKRTLARYTKDPLLISLERPSPTQTELYAMRQHLFEALDRHGARPVYAGTDVRAGRVEISIVGDRADLLHTHGARALPAKAATFRVVRHLRGRSPDRFILWTRQADWGPSPMCAKCQRRV